MIVERVNSNSVTKPSESGTLVSNMNQRILMWPHQISITICHNGHNSNTNTVHNDKNTNMKTNKVLDNTNTNLNTDTNTVHNIVVTPN